MRRGAKSTRANGKVSEQRLRGEMKQLSTFSRTSSPTIDLFLAGEGEVNDRENEGGLETKNRKMKVFIVGVQIQSG
jgi:hypothetical protein